MKRLGLLALAGLCLSGCVVVEHQGSGDATLILDWTIDGRKNPSSCRQSDAPGVQIIVLTASGREFDSFEADCEDFAASIDLPAGTYSASVALLDSHGDTRTTFVDTDTFRLFTDDEFEVDIDFPPSSFF